MQTEETLFCLTVLCQKRGERNDGSQPEKAVTRLKFETLFSRLQM
jgi:hypothetical protein